MGQGPVDIWGQPLPQMPMYGPQGQVQAPATPSPQPSSPQPPPNFQDWLNQRYGGQVDNLPDQAYEQEQNRFFGQYVAPWANSKGYALGPTQQDFLNQTQRQGKSSFPRTELVAKQALSSLLAPLKVFGPGPADIADNWTQRAAHEAVKQGINPAPYEFVGQAVGQLPYFAAGTGVAGMVADAAEATPLFEAGLKTAAVGLTQGAYDAAKAPSGQGFVEGMKGAAVGTALGAGFEFAGPLWRYLKDANPEMSEETAKALESTAKGIATDGQQQSAVDALLQHPQAEEQIKQYVTTQVQNMRRAGVPTDVDVSGAQGRIKVKMTGADGKPYNLGGVTGASLQDFSKIVERIGDHLDKGGEIVSVNGDHTVVHDFLNLLDKTISRVFDLYVPTEDAGTMDEPPPESIRTQPNDTIPNDQVDQIRKAQAQESLNRDQRRALSTPPETGNEYLQGQPPDYDLGQQSTAEAQEGYKARNLRGNNDPVTLAVVHPNGKVFQVYVDKPGFESHDDFYQAHPKFPDGLRVSLMNGLFPVTSWMDTTLQEIPADSLAAKRAMQLSAENAEKLGHDIVVVDLGPNRPMYQVKTTDLVAEDYNWTRANPQRTTFEDVYGDNRDKGFEAKDLGRVRGSADPPLNTQGIVDAQNKADDARDLYDAIVSGDRTRTVQTKNIFSKTNPYATDLGTDAGWNSWYRGEAEGSKDVEGWKKFSDDLVLNAPDVPHPGVSPHSGIPGESFNGFANRVYGGMQNVLMYAAAHPDERIGVFTHYNPIRLIQAYEKARANGSDMALDFEHFIGDEPNPGAAYRWDPVNHTVEPIEHGDDSLGPGIDLIRHDATDWNEPPEEGRLTMKTTGLVNRIAGPGGREDLSPVLGFLNEGDRGVTLTGKPGDMPAVIYNTDEDGVQRGTIHHEMLHAHFGFLGMHDWMARNFDGDGFVDDVYRGMLEPVGYQYGHAGEETFNFVSQAVRTDDQELMGRLANADTDREHVLNWYTDAAKQVLDRAATAPDSLHLRTLERRLNYTIGQASDQLEDVRNFAITHELNYDANHQLYYADDLKSGERKWYGDRNEALEDMQQHQEPLSAPELVDTSNLPPTPRYAKRLPPPNLGKAPIATDPPPPVRVGLDSLLSFVRPFYSWLGKVAGKYNRADLSDAFNAVDERWIDYDNAVRPFADVLEDAFGSQRGDPRLTDYFKFVSADTQEAKDYVIQQSRFTADELSKLYQFEDEFVKKVPGFEKYLKKTVPELEAMGWNVEDRYARGLDTSIEGPMVRQGKLDPRDTDLLRVSATYLRGSFFDQYMKPVIDDAETLANEQGEDGKYTFSTIRPLLTRQISYYRGQPDYTQQLIMDAIGGATDWINKGIEAINAHLPERMQLPSIESSPRDLLQKFIMLNYAGSLALRPALPVRNGLQLFLTSYPLLGEKYLFKGLRRSFEEGGDGWDRALKAGWLIDRSKLPEFLTQEPTEGGIDEKWLRKAMSVMTHSHNTARLVTGWSAFEKVNDALESFAQHGDGERYLKDSGLWFLDKAKRDMQVREASKLTLPGTEDAAKEAYAMRAARDLVDKTQWNYRRGAMPMLYKYQLGRLFGQYGMWPMNYIDYARNFVSSMPGVFRDDAIKSLTRLTLAHGAVGAAAAGLGIDAMPWLFTNPMAYGGGPMFQAVTSIPQSLDFETYKGAEARRNLVEPIWPGLIPGADEAREVWKAISDDSEHKWLHILGFHTTDEK